MLVFLRVYACVYVPYMAMHALRVAVGIGGLRLESIFERVAHQPAFAGGMRALHEVRQILNQDIQHLTLRLPNGQHDPPSIARW